MKRLALIPWLATTGCAGILLLQGCGTTRPELTPQQAKAVEFNHQALASLERGEHARALALFQQALILSRAAEDEKGIALNLLNLAQTHTDMGNPGEADRALDGILLEKQLAFAPRYRMEAMMRKSALALQRKESSAAGKWLEQAETLCAGNCTALCKLLNLRARTALDMQQPDAALAAATSALDHGRRMNDKTEIANSLRLQAAALLALNRPAAAEPALQEALVLDKEMTASEKIVQDLILLGRAQPLNSEAARNYWLRAREVAKASNNRPALREIDGILERNSGKTTE